MGFADRADHMHDAMLRRAWSRSPPQKRERRPVARTALLENIGNDNTLVDTTTERALQAAVRRVASLDRRVGILHQLRQRDAALRLAAVADGIRQGVLG